ncbi:hypothetical protein BC830DRAFT_1159251 [Chytriomyces sp. MP71]|nr:hypothetical protein BC830DRAFT_1159251 [Chytriomyces sp. MP71]
MLRRPDEGDIQWTNLRKPMLTCFWYSSVGSIVSMDKQRITNKISPSKSLSSSTSSSAKLISLRLLRVGLPGIPVSHSAPSLRSWSSRISKIKNLTSPSIINSRNGIQCSSSIACCSRPRTFTKTSGNLASSKYSSIEERWLYSQSLLHFPTPVRMISYQQRYPLSLGAPSARCESGGSSKAIWRTSTDSGSIDGS